MDDGYTVSFNSDTSDSEDNVPSSGSVIIKAAMSVETEIITENTRDIITNGDDVIENGHTESNNNILDAIHKGDDDDDNTINGVLDFSPIDRPVEKQVPDNTDTSAGFNTEMHVSDTKTVSEIAVRHVEEISESSGVTPTDDSTSASASSERDVPSGVQRAEAITIEQFEYSSSEGEYVAADVSATSNNVEDGVGMSNGMPTAGVCPSEGDPVLDTTEGVESLAEVDADINSDDMASAAIADLPGSSLDTASYVMTSSITEHDVFAEPNENTHAMNFEDTHREYNREPYSGYTPRIDSDKHDENDFSFRDKPEDGKPLTATEELIKRILAEAKAEQDGHTASSTAKPDVDVRPREVGSHRAVGNVEDEGGSTEQRYSYLERRSATESRRGWDSPYEGSTRGMSPYSVTSEDHDAGSMRTRFRHFGRYNNYAVGGVGDSDGYRSSAVRRYEYEGSDGEEFFDDSEFEPRRRAETEDVVRERTSDIRSMVDKQTHVLKKLKDASESFDELTNEIREIKKNFLENQYQRSLAFDDPDDNGVDYMATGSYYTVGGPSRETPYTYQPPSAYAPRRQLELDPELQSETLTGGGSLRNLARNDGIPRTTSLGLYDTQASSSDRYVSLSSYKKTLESSRDYRSRSYLDNVDDDDDDTPLTYRRPTASLSGLDDEDDEYARPRYPSGLSSGAYASSLKYRPSYGQYSTKTFASAAESNGTSRYGNISRSRTLPSSLSTERNESQFSSKFLSKVREQRSCGEEPSSAKRDKPFKSRFLKKSFDSAYGSYPSSAATTPSPVSRYPTFSAARVTSSDMRNGGDTESASATADTTKE